METVPGKESARDDSMSQRRLIPTKAANHFPPGPGVKTKEKSVENSKNQLARLKEMNDELLKQFLEEFPEMRDVYSPSKASAQGYFNLYFLIYTNLYVTHSPPPPSSLHPSVPPPLPRLACKTNMICNSELCPNEKNEEVHTGDCLGGSFSFLPRPPTPPEHTPTLPHPVHSKSLHQNMARVRLGVH